MAAREPVTLNKNFGRQGAVPGEAPCGQHSRMHVGPELTVGLGLGSATALGGLAQRRLLPATKGCDHLRILQGCSTLCLS